MHAVRWSLALTITLLTGCAAIPQPNTTHSLTRPALTNDSAQTVVKHYNEVSASADSRRSEDLIGGVQAGDLLRQTEAAYKISRVLKKPAAPTSGITVGSLGAPDYGSYPMRFVAAGNNRVGVWERPSAGSAWRSTFGVAPSAGVKVPDLAGMRAVAQTESAALAESPSVAASKFAEFMTVGASSPYAALFSTIPQVAKLQKQLADSRAWAAAQRAEIISMTDTFTVSGSPAAFRASSGEVLAFFTLTEAHLMRTPGTFESYWAAGEGLEAFSPPGQGYWNALTSTTLHQVLIAIPATKGPKVRVLAFNSQLVDAGGY